MDRKAAETMHNINNTFGPGSASEHTVQWWFRKFCKGNKRLEMRSTVAGYRKPTTNCEPSLKLMMAIQEAVYNYTRSC